MTPRAIADALANAPIEGLTYAIGTASPDAEPYLDLGCGAAAVTLYADADDLSGVFAVAGRLGASRLKTKEFWVRRKTLRADLVEILAWSLNACHPDPAAPDDRALPAYDGGHRTAEAPKGRRLTRAQRKALNARRGQK